MKSAIVVFALVTKLSSISFADSLQDGCYSMVEAQVGGVNDRGAICIEGLYDEGIGQNLKVVTIDSEGKAHFCAVSNYFGFEPSANPKLVNITLTSPKTIIVFDGDSESGTLKVGG